MRRHLLSMAVAGLLSTAATAHAEKVGVAAAVVPDAHSRLGSADVRQVRLGDQVLREQRFETDARGMVQILLVDGSSFTVGPNSSLVIDRFVYDPAKGTAQLAASASRGIMRFIGGAASKQPEGAKISTPVGVAGIRGAIADLEIPGTVDGQLRVDLQYGTQVVLSCGGGAVGSLSAAGSSMLVSGDGKGCGAVRYASGLPPLQPGAVATAPVADGDAADTGAALADDPNGLAGFSGAPMTVALAAQVQTPGAPGGVGGPQPVAPGDVLQARLETEAGRPVPSPVRTLDGSYSGFTSSFFGGSPDSGGAAVLHFDAATGTFSADLSPGYSSGQFGFGADGSHYRSDSDYAGVGSDGLFLRPDAAQSRLCACDFLQWGTWGNAATQAQSRIDGGYWLAANALATAAQLQQLPSNLVANYSGHAIGMVSSGGALHEATGDFWATVNFGTGTGGLIISNFDGRSFGDDALDLSHSPFNDNLPSGSFSGILWGDSSARGGQYTAAFAGNADDTVAALLGSFSLWDGSNWSAAGIFAGKHGNATQPMPYPHPPVEVLDGNYSGFASFVMNGSLAWMGADVDMAFHSGAKQFSAEFSPLQWEGASYTLAQGQYLPGSSMPILGANAEGSVIGLDPQALCGCDFLAWGQWNAEVPAYGSTVSAENGYWVVGQLTPLAELPTNVIASYAGQAVGTVLDDAGTRTGVTGDFTASVNFGTGTGSLRIANFDGRTFGDDYLSIPASSQGTAFGGLLYTASMSGEGEYTAGFAGKGSDKAAAMLGTFHVQEGGWQAAGVFAGKKTGTTAVGDL